MSEHNIGRWFGVVLAAFSVGAFGADNLSTVGVPYRSNAGITIGSGVDVDLIDQQRDSCLDLKDEDLKWLDSEGPVSTTATVELVTNYQSLTKTLGLQVDYKSTASVSVAALKGGAGVDLSLKYDDFAKNESNSVAIVVKASSDYGRKGLRSYPLRAEFKQLVTDKNFDEFRKRCGTHTVVAEHRDALVAVVITLTDVTASSKRAFEQMYHKQLSAEGTIKLADVKGSSDFTEKWKSVVESASRLGTAKVAFESRGGDGISDALKVSIAGNPQDVGPILAALSTVGGSFTREKSAPVEYILLSNTAFGADAKVVDAAKLDKLNSYYLQLSRIDYARKRIGDYKQSLPEVYDKYYSKPMLDLDGQRKQLIAAIEACVLSNQCAYQMPQDLKLLYAEDIILPDSVTLECAYKRYDSGDGKVRLNVITGAAVALRGKARLTNYVALPVATLTRLGPTVPGVPLSMPGGFQTFQMSEPMADGSVRFIAQLDNRVFHPEVLISPGSVIVQNEDQLRLLWQQLLSSVYSIGMQAKNGLFIQNTVGPPFGEKCPVTASVH